MTTLLIVAICMLGACLPISRLILNMIKRSDRYSDEYRRKAQIWQNVFRVLCILGAFVLLMVLESSLNSAD
ncbi:MAG: hypothetical protein K2N48_11470 [Muribaculaceae bacterium]|nr:hypothetical protein [Muribaculaceae bacterium]